MNAIVKTGIQESIVKQIGMIAGRTLATMEEHALTKWPILIVLVLLDLEVSCKINNPSFNVSRIIGLARTMKDILIFFEWWIYEMHFWQHVYKQTSFLREKLQFVSERNALKGK